MKEGNVDFDMKYLIQDLVPMSENVQCGVVYKSAMKCPQQAGGAVVLRIGALFSVYS